jgi:hypothetical protein
LLFVFRGEMNVVVDESFTSNDDGSEFSMLSLQTKNESDFCHYQH